MANNPRKFSEKIALHNQKQAEETLAFEKIMKEVMDATVPKVSEPIQTKQPHLLPINLGSAAYRGGSLPNVNQMAQHGDKGSQSRLGTMFNQQSTSPRSSRNSIGPTFNRVTSKSRGEHAPYTSPPNLSMLSQSMSSNAANICSSGLGYIPNYLSPPMENAAWRRANSDSALNQLMIPSVVPDSSEDSSNNSNDPREPYVHNAGKTHHSPNMLPNTVGDGPSLLEIPTPVSTGSLPDLTNFQFTTPLPQPIDMDEHSPYSTSPLSLTYSPSLSPHPPSGGNQQQTTQQTSSQPQQQSQVQISQSQHSQQQQQQSMLDNPLHVNVNTSFQNYSNDNMLTTYRCPPRPSPQNSPSPFRSPSPLDGHLSAPPSPTAQTAQNSPENYYLSQQAHALQRHFEQINMMETTERNNGHWQGGGMANSSPYFYNQQQTGATPHTTQQSPQHPQPQTPQTPSSIPDIIFTDFSEVRSEPLIEFLDSEAAAQAIRDGLGPIDLDGLQMLADPDLDVDPQAEDTFRLDRL